MKKLSFSEQSNILGGYSAAECKAVQALADTYAKEGIHDDDAWDEWCDLYDKYCV